MELLKLVLEKTEAYRHKKAKSETLTNFDKEGNAQIIYQKQYNKWKMLIKF